MNRLKKISSIIFFSIALNSPLSSIAAPAKETNLDILNDYSHFSAWIQKHSTFKCPNDSALQSTMEEQVPRVLFVGLKAIAEVNPELVAAKLKEKANTDVLFTCVPENKNRHWGAEYDPTPFFISSDSIRFSTKGKMILLPVNIIKNLFIDTMALEPVASKEPILAKKFWFMDSLYDQRLYNKNAIFHEYLHYLGFDNYSVDAHNSVADQNSPIRFDSDLVYSCAELSFPTWTLYFGHGRRLENGVVKDFDLAKACIMCALAIDSKPRLKTDIARAKYAGTVCEPYRQIQYR
ncbi:MAG: hypothetical protein ACXVCY_09370 [Pseudobdellovibrionaceae bacterium]